MVVRIACGFRVPARISEGVGSGCAGAARAGFADVCAEEVRAVFVLQPGPATLFPMFERTLDGHQFGRKGRQKNSRTRRVQYNLWYNEALERAGNFRNCLIISGAPIRS